MNDVAQVAAAQLAALLQDVHFAARALEEHVGTDPQDRLVDRIHAARVIVERLRHALGERAYP